MKKVIGIFSLFLLVFVLGGCSYKTIKDQVNDTNKNIVVQAKTVNVSAFYNGDDGFSLSISSGNNSTCIWTYEGGSASVPYSITTNANTATEKHSITFGSGTRDLYSNFKVSCFDDFGNQYVGVFPEPNYSDKTKKISLNTEQVTNSKYVKVAMLSDRMDSEIRLIGNLVKPGEKIALYDYNLDETANGVSLYEKNGGWLLKQEYYCSKNISSQVENVSKKTGVTYYKGDFDLVSLEDFKNYLSQNNANCIQVLNLERSGETKKVLAYGLEADGMIIWKNR